MFIFTLGKPQVVDLVALSSRIKREEGEVGKDGLKGRV